MPNQIENNTNLVLNPVDTIIPGGALPGGGWT